ncbi:putative propionate kinase [Pirellula sp. SH-Sr6A]|uniref:acetate/propionate family kinase n=1 Tax=Pirellula sp. SH-Sr6A TaxID=1632865 RepID=UPI00078BFFF0|nr:acetate/propionate family kinase [Pirellula sp. SH-Sr6A]AMV32452.1 putative propionate kinase [Pirellula sp. SH-Sr6A]
MTEALLVLNSGSSSLKFSVFQIGDLTLLVRGQIEGLGTAPRFLLRGSDDELLEESNPIDGARFDHSQAMGLIIERLREQLVGVRIVGVGHRVVHGGVKYATPIRVNESVLEELGRLIPLAPLHQPYSLAAIRSLSVTAPELPQVACFDTAFHRTQPPVAQWFGLPRSFTEQGLLRYGFHGISYEYIASVLPAMDPRAASGRTIVAHLGNGASLCALSAGKSIATTMSFTPVDGLVMGTRVGSLDPGVLLYLMASHGMDAASLEKLIYHDSGLLGVSGLSSDMRTLLASTDSHATEAIDLFVYRLGRELGSLAAALGGLDALVFTGGIGANAAVIRSRVCHDAAWLGLSLDEESNQKGYRQLHDHRSEVTIWSIATNEELMIAQQTQRVLRLSDLLV